MFRLALIVSLLFTFAVVTHEGPIIDPNGGRPHLTRHATSDQGPTVDPNGGGVHASGSGGADPNG